MAKDRAKDARRTVGSHEKMMGALGRAAGWKRDPFFNNDPAHLNETLGEIQTFTPGAGHVKTKDNKGPWPVEADAGRY